MEQSEEVNVRPWVRFWARMFDYEIWILIFGTALYVSAGPALAFSILMPVMALFVWCFIETIFLSTFGYTPGKWLLKVKVRSVDGKKLSFRQALQRSLSVWWLGYGAGIPLLNIVTMIVACVKLTNLKITTWDRYGYFRVSHSKIGFVRCLVVILFFLCIGGFITSSLHEGMSYETELINEQDTNTTPATF